MLHCMVSMSVSLSVSCFCSLYMYVSEHWPYMPLCLCTLFTNEQHPYITFFFSQPEAMLSLSVISKYLKRSKERMYCLWECWKQKAAMSGWQSRKDVTSCFRECWSLKVAVSERRPCRSPKWACLASGIAGDIETYLKRQQYPDTERHATLSSSTIRTCSSSWELHAQQQAQAM